MLETWKHGNIKTSGQILQAQVESFLNMATFGLTMENIPRIWFDKLHDYSRNNFTTLKMNLLMIFFHRRKKWSSIDQLISLK